MDNKDLLIETMTKQNANLTALVQTLTESNAALNETIKELQETIRELQRQLNQNSQNSSKPPSSDGFTSRGRRACAEIRQEARRSERPSWSPYGDSA